ncbi:MAG: hypothetical protein ACRC4N_04720 [Gammaproteobacteria bacterium]
MRDFPSHHTHFIDSCWSITCQTLQIAFHPLHLYFSLSLSLSLSLALVLC